MSSGDKPGPWVDWSEPHLKKTAENFLSNVQKVMSGNLNAMTATTFMGQEEQPVELAKAGDSVQINGPEFGIPRTFFGTVQSTHFEMCNVLIESVEDIQNDTGYLVDQMNAGRVRPLSASDLPPDLQASLLGPGEVIMVPLSCARKV